MVELEKKFRFEMAHRLSHGYDGKCANIHGHSWNGSLFIRSTTDELDEFGMLMDYSDIKKITSKIEERFDHKLVLSSSDPMLKGLVNLNIINKRVEAIEILNSNPTSEVIAEVIYNMAGEYLDTHKLSNAGFYVSKVVIAETCTSSCTYVGRKD
jgi:6-pyruvoyltetrahydropterin/6-carboxytetrahydropterin synthase